MAWRNCFSVSWELQHRSVADAGVNALKYRVFIRDWQMIVEIKSRLTLRSSTTTGACLRALAARGTGIESLFIENRCHPSRDFGGEGEWE